MPISNVREYISLEYETFGDKNDPLVLLIPGAGAHLGFWPDVFCAKVADSGRFVVRYNQRDTGLSTHVDKQYPIEELLLDMQALVDVLGYSKVHLVGHSMGGYIAQMALKRSPFEIASVTSISAGPTVAPDIAVSLGMSSVTDDTWQVLMNNQPVGDFAQDLSGWMQVWRYLNGSVDFDEQSATRYTHCLYQGDPRNAQVADNHIFAMTTVPEDLIDQLRSSSCPLLVIHGTEDPLVPFDNGLATARLVTGSKLVRLQGAGHMFFNSSLWDNIANQVVSHTEQSDANDQGYRASE